MMTKTLDLFQSLFEKNKERGFLLGQESDWEKFLVKGLPDKKTEAFQYFPFLRFSDYFRKTEFVKNIVCLEEISSLVLPESKDSCIVLKDGVFCRELSCISGLMKKVVVMSLQEAFASSYGAFLRHRQQMLSDKETDPFALLNGALCEGGLFIYVPPKVKLSVPLQILFACTNENMLYTAPRVHIFAGADSELQLTTSSEGGGVYNGFVDIAVEERATVFYTSYIGKRKEDFGFTSFRASLKQDACLESVSCLFEPNCRREDFKVFLLGQRARVDLLGLSAVSDSGQSHIHVEMNHMAPSCYSKQLFKQVLADRSRSSFTGKIHVMKPAQKTEAYQLNRSLLLSDDAITYTKPGLEIFADDVKASHGATVAQIDDEQKFYLQSRGVPEEEAKLLLTQGFCGEILDKISLESLEKKCREEYRSFSCKEG